MIIWVVKVNHQDTDRRFVRPFHLKWATHFGVSNDFDHHIRFTWVSESIIGTKSQKRVAQERKRGVGDPISPGVRHAAPWRRFRLGAQRALIIGSHRLLETFLEIVS